MKTVQIAEPNRVEVFDLPRPEPRETEVLLRVMASGICGTDIHILRGQYLAEYPVIPGHEFSGVVEQVGRQVTRFKPGDRVAVEPNVACDNCESCLNNRQNFCENWQGIGVTRSGGMAQYAAAPQKAVFDIGDLPFEQAAFMEPLSCVIHGIEKTGLRLGSRVAILGAGPIGILLLKAIRLLGGCEVAVAEKNEARRSFAERRGADTAVADLDGLRKDYYDVVIDATGAPSAMKRTFEFARRGGTVLLFGVAPGGARMEIEPFEIFRKGLSIHASFTSVRNSLQAVSLLRSGRMDVDELISHRLPLQDFERGVEIIERGAENVMKAMVFPNG